MRNGKVATIPIYKKDLFYRWLELTKPFHKLPPQQIRFLSLLLFYYDKYKIQTNSEELAWKLVFNYDTKKEIKEVMNIKDQSLQNLFTVMRGKNIIKDNKVIDRYIPNVEKDAKEFRLIFNFKILDE